MIWSHHAETRTLRGEIVQGTMHDTLHTEGEDHVWLRSARESTFREEISQNDK